MPDLPPRLTQALGDRYEIQRELGSGGSGRRTGAWSISRRAMTRGRCPRSAVSPGSAAVFQRETVQQRIAVADVAKLMAEGGR